MEVEKGEHLLKYQTTENVQSIPIKEIQPFRNHPFTVADNEDMAKIVESIGKVQGRNDYAVARKTVAGRRL